MAKGRAGGRGAVAKGKGVTAGGANPARQPAPNGSDCLYAGQHYSEGAIIDQGGVMQRCVNGKWQVVDPSLRSRAVGPHA